MKKSVPTFLAAGAVGLACCLTLAGTGDLAAQQPKRPRERKPAVASTPTPSAAGDSTSAAGTDPSGTNVETPPATDGSKPESKDAQTSETEILASQGANFASKDRIAVFNGDVRVNDPRFQLACDKLTVYLAKGAMADAGSAPTPAAAATPPPLNAGGNPPGGKAKDSSNPGGGIDHAKAEGHVIIIQKRPPAKPGDEPKISIGRGDEGDFDNKTGDMTLRGTPSVEQNSNSLQSLSPTTVIILHKDNSMDVHGPSRTVIIQKKGSTGLDLPGGNPGGNNAKPGSNAPPAASPVGSRAKAGNT